jgi:predicted HAD superfamily Cof-like phosphohydrolase
MQDQLNAVAAFHQAFNVGVSQNPTTNVTNDIALLRHRLMAEENNEYLEAVENKDIVEVADALGDMLYILCGTILTHGIQHIIEDVFAEIQESNMSKLGADGKPIYRRDGKVMKGPHYHKPDLKQFLDQSQTL